MLTLKFRFDASHLAPARDEANPTLHLWTSLQAGTQFVPVPLGANSQSAGVLEAQLSLRDDYSAASVVEAEVQKDADGRLRLPADAAVWFEALASKRAKDGRDARQRVGSGFVYVRDLLEPAQFEAARRVELRLFNHTNEKSGRADLKGVVLLEAAEFDADTLAAHAEGALLRPPIAFDYLPQNHAFLSSVIEGAIVRAITPVTDDALAAGFGIPPAHKEVKRVHAPLYNSTAGLVPGSLFWALPHYGDPSEKWALRQIRIALRRRNRTLEWLEKTLRDQFAQPADSTRYNNEVTDAAEVVATALNALATSLPYISDTTDTATRLTRDSSTVASMGSVQGSESFDDALLRTAGDCEDLGRACHAAYMAMKRGKAKLADASQPWTARGGWSTPALQQVQRLLHCYLGAGNLSSVLSASLGNELESDKHKPYIMGTARDDRVQTGAHLFNVLHPAWKIHAMLQKTTPGLKRGDFVKAGVAGAWQIYLPSLLQEGTGRLRPLQLARVVYHVPAPGAPLDQVRAERQAIVDREARRQTAIKHLVQNAELFKYFSLERPQSQTEFVCDQRISRFYRKTVSWFCPELLDLGFGNSELLCVQVGEIHRDSEAHADSLALGARAAFVSNCACPVPCTRCGCHAQLGAVPGTTACSCQVAAGKVNAFEEMLSDSDSEQTAAAPDIHPAAHAHAHPVGTLAAALAETRVSDDALEHPAYQAAAAQPQGTSVRYGLDVTYTLHSTPVKKHCALLPVSPLDQVEAAAAASIIRHLCAPLVPSVSMDSFSPAKALPAGDERPADQRGVRVDQPMLDRVKQFAQRVAEALPALPSHEAIEQAKHAYVCFFIRVEEFSKDAVVDKLVADVANQAKLGAIVAADVVLETPTDHVYNVLLRVAADPAKMQK